MTANVLAMTTNSANAAPPIERLFVSGHSLTDPPLPQYLALIASSLGQPLQWNMQSIGGSPIQRRTHGGGPAHAYRDGANREGSNMNVLEEWRAPRTVQGGLYDALLVTEQNGILSTLAWHQTIGSLQGIHENFLQANPRATTWFYEAWFPVDSRSDPARWMAYERAAAPVWRCIAARVNAARAAAGHQDRIASVPSGVALVSLVERASQGKLPDLETTSMRQVVELLLSDDVHLTELGSYYMASVVYSTLWGRSPEGAAAPAQLKPATAAALQKEAWSFVREHQASVQPMSMSACRSLLKDTFIQQYWGYVRDTQWSKDRSKPSAYFNWLRQIVEWQWRIRKKGGDNPFPD